MESFRQSIITKNPPQEIFSTMLLQDDEIQNDTLQEAKLKNRDLLEEYKNATQLVNTFFQDITCTQAGIEDEMQQHESIIPEIQLLQQQNDRLREEL